MTHRKVRLLTLGAALGWVLGLLLPVVSRDWLTIEALILVDMLILAGAITTTVLAVIARSLPPVAAAWFLGYREAAAREPEKDDGRRLRSVGD